MLCAAAGAATSYVVVAFADQRLRLPVGAAGRVGAAVAAALLCGIIAWRYGGQASLHAMLWLACLGVVLCVIDLRHRRLPDALVAALFAGGVVLLGVAAIQDGTRVAGLGWAVIASGIVLALGLLGLLVAGAGVGRGDVTFSAALALYLGARGWTAVALGFLLASMLLAVAAVWVVAVRGGGRHRRLAAGPSLFLGAVGAVLALAPGG